MSCIIGDLYEGGRILKEDGQVGATFICIDLFELINISNTCCLLRMRGVSLLGSGRH